MSHLKERSAKNCLNCNAQVQGRYCHVCGQENIEPKETVWHLLTHFFNDITHFDGKFFSTLKYLLIKPGFLSSEYRIGRRAAYLNPIRMYVFTSAIFFLIFFSLFNPESRKLGMVTYDGKTAPEINAMDAPTFAAFTKKLNKGNELSRAGFETYKDSVNKVQGLHFTPRRYKNRAEYDSLLRTGVKKHNWLERTLVYKDIEINEKYKNDQSKILNTLGSILIHSFPQMLFISLPLFALMLQLLYIRRKQFYFANHAIFAVHLYIFTFIALLLVVGLGQIRTLLHWKWMAYLIGLFDIYILYYEYKAMRNFYGQSRGKTLLKFFLLNFLLLIIIIILFIVFLFLSFLKI